MNKLTQAIDTLLLQIERGNWQLGEKIPSERALSQSWGLSRAAVREAIAEASGNHILSQSLEGLFALLRANVTKNIGAITGRRPETRLRLMKQHTSLFEAIYYGKPEKARATAQEHMAFVDRILNDL